MEEKFVQNLKNSQKPNKNILLGIGDDAAILDSKNKKIVVTVDLLTEGVDFLLGQVPNTWIGRKSIAVNLSDLAAMAAQPLAVVVAVALPKNEAALLAEELYAGITPLLEKYSVSLIGGDTNTWDGGLVISVTAIGETTQHGPLKRSGAKPGDRILVTGEFGGSLLQHQFLFEPRVNEALSLNEDFSIHAAMDVSDGLSLDLSRLSESSRCGAVIDLEKIPIRNDAYQMKDHQSPLEHALYDGEDFELIFAVSPQEAKKILEKQPLGVCVTDIGEFVPESGQWFREKDGTQRKVIPRGYEH